MIDRYYYDFMVDPIRYRMDIGQRLAWGGYKVIPKPDVVLCLDASAEVLQSRKQEVTFQETARQRDAYLKLTKRLSYGHVIDSSQPLEQVVQDALRIVHEHLDNR